MYIDKLVNDLPKISNYYTTSENIKCAVHPSNLVEPCTVKK